MSVEAFDLAKLTPSNGFRLLGFPSSASTSDDGGVLEIGLGLPYDFNWYTGASVAAQVQAAVAAASANGGGTVLLNASTVALGTTTVTVPTRDTIRGRGRQATTVTYTGSGSAFDSPTPTSRTYGQGFEDFTLSGSGSSGATGIAMSSMSSGFVRNVAVSSFATGVKFTGPTAGFAVYNTCEDLVVSLCPVGIRIEGGSNEQRFIACRINVSSTVGFDIEDSNHVMIAFCAIEGSEIGVRVVATSGALADGNLVFGNRFEHNTTAVDVGTLARMTVIAFNHILSTGGVVVDNGERTQWIEGSGVARMKSATQDAPFRFERTANGGTEAVAMRVVDSVTSTGTPVTLQIETGRATGWFVRGVRSSTKYFDVKADGTGWFAAKLLTAGGLGVGNSGSASTLGTVVRRMEVFDADGASLGFVPIYNSIT